MNNMPTLGAYMAEQSLKTAFDSGFNPIAMGAQNLTNLETLGNAFGRPGRSQDAISRFAPPANDAFPFPQINPLNPLGSLLDILMQLLSTFQSPSSTGNGDHEQFFQNAAAGSNGDPHLSFNGATWDSMTPHPDLLHSDSIPGGFQISTDTTTPSSNGVTYNRQATVATNWGNSNVSLDNRGNATATIDGAQTALSPGQSIALGAGTIATRNQDGSITVTSQNERGGQITTTLRQNGQGIDVNATANNVDLGGDLVTGQSAPPPQFPQAPPPEMRRYTPSIPPLT